MTGLNLNSTPGSDNHGDAHSEEQNKGVNLIYGSQTGDTNPTKAVTVDDHDDKPVNFKLELDDKGSVVPEDLISEKPLSGFSLGKYKVWISSFVVALLVFSGVIYLINNSNNQVQEKLESTESQVANTDDIPSFFTGSIANLSNLEAPDAGATNNNAAATDAGTGSATQTEANPEAPGSDPFFEVENDEFDFSGLIEDVGEIETDGLFDGPVIENEEETVPDLSFEELLGSANTVTQPTVTNTVDTSLGLGSNTLPETLLAGEMQGNTGPALWFALIPSLAYGVFRKKK